MPPFWTRVLRFFFAKFQAHGKTLESFVSQHQDSARNALQKSAEAAYNSWVEELRADQAQFLSEKILSFDPKI